MIEKKFHAPALRILASISAYPDYNFDQESGNENLSKKVEECYKEISLNKALNVFLEIEANEKQVQASRKIALILFRKFNQVYTDFSELTPYKLVKLTEKFTRHKWLFADTYNKILQAFAVGLENFTAQETATLINHLGNFGVISENLIGTGLSHIEKSFDKDTRNYVNFNRVIIPLFETLVNLN